MYYVTRTVFFGLIRAHVVQEIRNTRGVTPFFFRSCRQLVQSAGFVKANQAPPGSKGGSTKHFYRMATRNASRPITSEQASCIKRSPTAHQ